MSGPVSISITIQSVSEWSPAAPTGTILHPPLASPRCFTQVGTFSLPVNTDMGLEQGWAPTWQVSNAHCFLTCLLLQQSHIVNKNTSKLHCQHLGCLRGRHGSKSKSTATSASPQSLSWNVSYISGSYVCVSCCSAAAMGPCSSCLEVSKRCLAAYDRAPCRGGLSKLPAGIY